MGWFTLKPGRTLQAELLKQTIRRGVLAVLVVLLVGGVALAQAPSPEEKFYDPAILQGALADIAQMQEPELRGFMRYAAECSDYLGVEAAARRACSVAMTTYEMEFGANRALDDWIYAKSAMEEMRMEEMRQADPRSLPTETEAIVALAIRYGEVISAIQGAVRDRFRVLSRK